MKLLARPNGGHVHRDDKECPIATEDDYVEITIEEGRARRLRLCPHCWRRELSKRYGDERDAT